MNIRFEDSEDLSHLTHTVEHGQAKREIRGGLIRSYPSYFDEYLGCSGELHIHFRLVENCAITHREILRKHEADYCVVLSKFSVGVDSEVCEGSGANDAPEGKYSGDILDPTTDYDKVSMLICVFETADDSEDVAIRFGPQTIRLRLYNTCPSFRSQPFDGTLKVVSPLGVIDHEIAVIVRSEDILKQNWKTGTLLASAWNTGDDDVVQCTTKVMYEITEHYGNHGIRLLDDTHAVVDMTLGIRQPDTSKLIRMAACVPPGFSIDVYHVLLGTLDLEPPRVLEVRRHELNHNCIKEII